MHLLAFERVTANELPEGVGLVRRCALMRAHFVQHDTYARFRSLKCSLTAGQTGANDLNAFQTLF